MENQNDDMGREIRLASFQESEQRERQSIEAIDNRLTVRRIDFEVSKRQSRSGHAGLGTRALNGHHQLFSRLAKDRSSQDASMNCEWILSQPELMQRAAVKP
jgi:hypothetical protein